MSQAIENAMKRLTEIEKEAEKIRLFIDLYSEFSDDSVAVEVEKSGDESTSAAEINEPTGQSIARKSHAKPAEVVPAAIEAMRSTGRPMTRSEVVEALEKQGMTIGGTDKNKNMGTVLWRSKKFESVEGLGYWPLELGDWEIYSL